MEKQDTIGAAPGDSSPERRAPHDSSDLSREVAAALERQPGDTIRCTRVGAETYRCNWWAPETPERLDVRTFAGLVVTTERVRQSRFLHVTRSAAGLVIRACAGHAAAAADE